MEYTKDIILDVNYGHAQNNKKRKKGIYNTLKNVISKHIIIVSILSITVILMFFDFILITSFVDVLNSI